MLSRSAQLEFLFEEFDAKRTGHIDLEELQKIGQARREIGHRDVKWTMEQTKTLLADMDVNHNGTVEKWEFVNHFNKVLPQDREVFDLVIKANPNPNPNPNWRCLT